MKNKNKIRSVLFRMVFLNRIRTGIVSASRTKQGQYIHLDLN